MTETKITDGQRERAKNIFCATRGCYHYSETGVTHCYLCMSEYPEIMSHEDTQLKKLLDAESTQ